jgi:hypothetical protein
MTVISRMRHLDVLQLKCHRMRRTRAGSHVAPVSARMESVLILLAVAVAVYLLIRILPRMSAPT